MPKTQIFMVIAATVLVATTSPASAQMGLARADANNDGAVSREEAMQARQKMFTRLDRNSDGQISADEIERARTRVEAMARMIESVIVLRSQRMDADGDGSLTQAEFMAENPMFDRIDRNGDGIASADEIAEVREKFQARRK